MKDQQSVARGTEPGAARRGQSHQKSTREVCEQRTYEVAQLIAKRIPKHQIKRALNDKYGLGHRQAEEYLSRARKLLIWETQRPKEQHVSEAMAVYEKIIRDPESPNCDVMNAQAAIRQMLGLDMPTKSAQTDAAGNDIDLAPAIVADLSNDELELLAMLRRRMLAAATNEPKRLGSQENSDSRADVVEGRAV